MKESKMDIDKIRNSNQEDVLPEQPNTLKTSCNFDVNKDIVAETKQARDHYINKIKHMETLFVGFTDITKNGKLDFDQKANAKQCLTKLKKCIKRIREADIHVKKSLNTLLDYKIQDDYKLQVLQHNRADDSDSVEIIDFPEKRSRSKVLHPSNKVSALYQFFVYNLLYSLLLSHDEISSFSRYQADIIWVLGNQSFKKNQFPTEIIPKKLSRGDCLELIAKVLEENGIHPIPLSSILKQLSSWNVYLSSYGKKGTMPILLYDFYRERTKDDFYEWVKRCYLPDFKKSHPQSIEPEKQRHGEAALDQAALELFTNTADFYRNIDDEIEQQDEQKAMQIMEGFLLALKKGDGNPEEIIGRLKEFITSHIRLETELRKENMELHAAIEKINENRFANN